MDYLSIKPIENTFNCKILMTMGEWTIDFVLSFDELISFIKNRSLKKTDALCNFDISIDYDKNTTHFMFYPHVEYIEENGQKMYNKFLKYIQDDTTIGQVLNFFEHHKRYHSNSINNMEERYHFWIKLDNTQDLSSFDLNQPDCSFGDYIITCFSKDMSEEIVKVIRDNKLDYETVMNYNILEISIVRSMYSVTKELIKKYGLGKSIEDYYIFENALFNPGSYILPLLHSRGDYDMIKFFFDNGMTEDYYIHLM